MNKRDLLLSLAEGTAPPAYTPAAFFLHFDAHYHAGPAAISKHLEFFRATGMDFVKVQFEQTWPDDFTARQPADWANAPLYPESFFEAPVGVAEGLAKAAGREALVIMTVYSPFMWARHFAPGADLSVHAQENPAAVQRGLEIMTENVLRLVRGCQRAGVDGFYVSTQGGEAGRFQDPGFFQRSIVPTDLAVWDEIKDRAFNILHVCDFDSGYDDLSPFLAYPGHVVNCSLAVGGRRLTPKEASALFGRPFMGGLERKGVLATGPRDAIRQAAQAVLAEAPERFILAADCTVPGETPWENLQAAIEAAHQHRT